MRWHKSSEQNETDLAAVMGSIREAQKTMLEHERLAEKEIEGIVVAIIEHQHNAFVAKFGRKPTHKDPVFFDPDAAKPKRAKRIVKERATKLAAKLIFNYLATRVGPVEDGQHRDRRWGSSPSGSGT